MVSRSVERTVEAWEGLDLKCGDREGGDEGAFRYSDGGRGRGFSVSAVL